MPAAERPIEADPYSGSASVVRRWPAADTEAALVLVRHGETEWSRSGRHTGTTDIPLTERGERQARAAGPLIRAVLGSAGPALVLSSPRQRAWRTAELAGFDDRRHHRRRRRMGLRRAGGPHLGRDPAGTGRAGRCGPGPMPGGEDAAAVTVRLDRLLAASPAGWPDRPDRAGAGVLARPRDPVPGRPLAGRAGDRRPPAVAVHRGGLQPRLRARPARGAALEPRQRTDPGAGR